MYTGYSEEFLEKMRSFTMDKDIINTYKSMVKLIDKEHEGV